MKQKLFILFTIMLVVLSIVGCSSQKEESKAKEQPKTKVVKHAKGKQQFQLIQRELLTYLDQQKNYYFLVINLSVQQTHIKIKSKII